MDVAARILHIKTTIEHSRSIAHIECCIHWVEDLLRKKMIDTTAYKQLYSILTERYETLASQH